MTSTVDYVLIYARASSDPDDLRISVDHQIKRCTRFATDEWPEAELLIFRDDDITAAKPGVIRPDFDRFRHTVRTLPKGSMAIVANEQSRLTRLGETGWDDIRVLCALANIETVHSLKEGPISVKKGASLVGSLLALVHRETAERIAADVKNTHAELFQEGRPSGRAPFGYLSAKDEDRRPQLVADPDAAPWVKQAFIWALEGHAVAVIADKLNAAGVLPRSASFKFKDGRTITGWTSTSVRTLLKSPTVAGLRAHTDDDGVLHTTPARWDELVDVDTWNKVQRMLGQPTTVTGANGETYRVRTKPASKPRRYLLSGGRRRDGEVHGVLLCGKCKKPMVAQTQGRRGGVRVPAYQCHPKGHPDACGGVSISTAVEVEAHVVFAIQAELAANQNLRQRLNATTDTEADHWRAERDAAKGRMLDAATLLGMGVNNGGIDRDSFDVMHGAAKAAYDVAENRLSAMTSDRALPSADDVIHRWDTLTLAVQRAVIERLIERIEVAPGHRGHPGFNEARLGDPVWRV